MEGAEYLVLSGVDFSRYIFLAITIERPTESTHELLISHGYVWLRLLTNFGECLYIHKRHKNFDRLVLKNRNMKFTNWHRHPHLYLLKNATSSVRRN